MASEISKKYTYCVWITQDTMVAGEMCTLKAQTFSHGSRDSIVFLSDPHTCMCLLFANFICRSYHLGLSTLCPPKTLLCYSAMLPITVPIMPAIYIYCSLIESNCMSLRVQKEICCSILFVVYIVSAHRQILGMLYLPIGRY